MSRRDGRLVLSCEHGGNRIPKPWAALFRRKSRLLDSHRGWDPGALGIARVLARRLDAPLVAATTSRLLIDLNRSPGNPARFSEVTRRLPMTTREVLDARLHAPHWQRVREALDAARSPVVHIAVHSFTPRIRRRVRRFDVGLLYDPSRAAERDFAASLQARWMNTAPGLRVRRNVPYRGDSDGLTTAMRRERPPKRYLGLELELNQSQLSTSKSREWLLEGLAQCLAETLDEQDGPLIGSG